MPQPIRQPYCEQIVEEAAEAPRMPQPWSGYDGVHILAVEAPNGREDKPGRPMSSQDLDHLGACLGNRDSDGEELTLERSPGAYRCIGYFGWGPTYPNT